MRAIIAMLLMLSTYAMLVAATSVTAINALIATQKSTDKAAATFKTATCVTNVKP